MQLLAKQENILKCSNHIFKDYLGSLEVRELYKRSHFLKLHFSFYEYLAVTLKKKLFGLIILACSMFLD